MILILISELALFHCPRWFQDLVQQNNTLIEEMLYLIIMLVGKFGYFETFMYCIDFKKFFLIFIYLFLTVLGLCCCAWAFSS